jgi:hypothetical protein
LIYAEDDRELIVFGDGRHGATRLPRICRRRQDRASSIWSTRRAYRRPTWQAPFRQGRSTRRSAQDLLRSALPPHRWDRAAHSSPAADREMADGPSQMRLFGRDVGY